MTDSNPEPRPFSALPKPEPAEAAPAREPRPRRFFGEGAFGIFVLLILAAMSGGLIAIYWPLMGRDTSDVSDRVAALETRVGQMAAGQAPKAAAASFEAERRDLAALQARVDADEARLNALEKTSGDAAALADEGARLDAVEKALAQLNTASLASQKTNTDLGTRVATLEKNAPPADLVARLNTFALKNDTTAMDARIARLEARDPAVAMRRSASVLALAELVRASESNAPFAAELSALHALASSPEISDLAHYSKGVPTRAMLEQRFPAQADAILAAERRSYATNWLEHLWASLVELVSVRRVGNVTGNDTEARVARAEFDLKAGDLDRAVAELNLLVGPAHDAAAPWLADAKARAAIIRDTRALTNRIIAGLAPPQ